MYQFTLFISGLLAHCLHTPTVKTVEVVRTVEVRDPSGLIRTDLEFLKQHTSEVHWKPCTTLEQVAYAQGQQDLISFIEKKVMGRRVDRL